MDYKIPESVQKILNEQVRAFCAKFQKRGFQIYTVGGSVRDLLMGRGVHDWDFTTDATPEEILKLFPEGFYDNKFGTVGVKAGDVQIYEITTMRKEGKYEDFRHPEKVLWTNKIEEDLARRDFTINAIALRLVYTECNRSAQGEPPNFEIVDPYDGQEDIKNKLIRAVGDPDRRFKEDALRLIRAIRFVAQLGFEIEEKTYLAIKKNTHLISEVANERIRDELFKLLGSDNPLLGIEKMRDTGILQIILPEVEKSFGVSQVGPKHARVYDIGSHLFLTLNIT